MRNEKEMTKSKTTRFLVKEVARQTGYLIAPTKEVIECLEKVMEDYIIRGYTVKLGPIEMGSKKYPRQAGVNPKTGEPFDSPEHTVPYARIRQNFKKKYKGELDNG